MSLILEALRKSEAERRRGRLPKLDSRPLARQRSASWLPTAALGIATLGVASGVGFWLVQKPSEADAQTDVAVKQAAEAVGSPLTGAQTSEPVTAEVASALPPLTPSDLPARESTPAPTFAMGGAQDGSTVQVSGGGGEWPAPTMRPPITGSAEPMSEPMTPPPQTTETAVASASTPPSQPASPQVSHEQPQATTQLTMPVAANPAVSSSVPVAATENAPAFAAPATPAEAESVADPADKLLLVHELPYQLRRDLPKMAFTMHVYAKDPNKRFAMINGRRFYEGGEPIETKVNVIAINADGVVCEFSGTQFLLPRP
jgi:general secretion pathway protein B